MAKKGNGNIIELAKGMVDVIMVCMELAPISVFFIRAVKRFATGISTLKSRFISVNYISILLRFIVFNKKLCEARLVILPLPPFLFNGSYCTKDSFNYHRWYHKSGVGGFYKGCN